MNRTMRFLSAGLFLLASAACSPDTGSGGVSSKEPPPAAVGVMALRSTGDTVYRRRMNDLLARSRLVPVDSLARLYAALAATPEPARHQVRQAIMCQYAILLGNYGQAATGRAKARVIDSLERSGLDWRKAMNLLDDGPGPDLEVSEQACGELPVPHLPDSLEFEPPPPRG